jgi:hypothetical protein
MTWAARLPTLGGPRYDADASRVFTAWSTQPSDARKANINTSIVALKTSGLWPKIDRFYATGKAHSQQAATVDWKTGAVALTLRNSPTFVADTGFTSDGSTSDVEANFNPATAGGNFSLNSNGLWMWVGSVPVAATSFPAGNLNNRIGRSTTNNNQLARNTTTTNDSSATPILANTLIGNTRTGAAGYDLFQGGVVVQNIVRASSALSSVNLTFLSAAGAGYTAGMSLQVGIITGGLTPTEAASLHTIVAAFMAGA